ncbi:hypothetical protein ColTof3_01416 [Colletotrichum tofieldiae]|nr:hypothetical protein ColTof3_01416 [Colletotrichum tofieldiae]
MLPKWASRKEASYDTLSLDPDLDEKPSPTRQSTIITNLWSKFSTLLTTTAILVLLVALCSVTALYLRLLHQTSPLPPAFEDCGHSVEEAKSRGCVFDELIPAWMPASCPRVGSNEFVAAGRDWESRNGTSFSSWRYYIDAELKREVSVDQLAEMAQ